MRRWLPEWRGADRADVTIRHLLTHSSGLTAYLPFYRDLTGRPEFQHAICGLPLEYAPDSQSIYSDLGFILLAFILEDAAAAANRSSVPAGAFDPSASFAEQFHSVASFLTADPLIFNPPRTWRRRCAPTEIDHWRGRLLDGRSARRELLGARRRRRSCRPVRHRCRRRRLRSRRASHDPRRTDPGAARDDAHVHDPQLRPRQLPRARLGHDAADVILRNADVAVVRSATPGSPARHCGSTGNAIFTSCC